MAPCSDMSWVEKSGIETHDRVIEAHTEIEQWFCPNAFDLSFYGSSDDVIKKALFVDVKSNDDAYLEGKHVALLANSRDIEFTDSHYEEVHIHNFTELIWLPINSKTPMSNEITYTNHEFFTVEKEFDQYKLELEDREKLEWISMDHHAKSIPYAFPTINTDVKSQIIFQTSHDL